MADISQTAANVKLISGPYGEGVAGETLTQGQPIYLSGNTGLRCDANDTETKAACRGIVLTPATSGGTFLYAKPGAVVDLGATLIVTQLYIVSANVGAIAPYSDLATASYLTVLGGGKTAAQLLFDPYVLGVQKP